MRVPRYLLPCTALLEAVLIAPTLHAQGLLRARPCRGETISAITYSQRPPAFRGELSEASRIWEVVTGLPHTTTRTEVLQRYLPVHVGDTCTEFARHEAERVIRGQPYVADAVVRPIDEGAGRVQLEVDTIDEFPLTVAGMLGHGSLSSLSVGNTNWGGTGLDVTASVERGFRYRDGFGLSVMQYGAFGQPWSLAARAVRAPTGEQWGLELSQPLLTDLQRTAFHIGASSSTDYSGLTRPSGDAIAYFLRRSAYDAGHVWRYGNPGGLVGILGGVLMGEDTRVDLDNFVVLSDSGIVHTPPVAAIAAEIRPYTVTRLGVVVGYRDLTYKTVRNFDAVRAQQDVAAGSQLIIVAGPSFRSSSAEADVFGSADLYVASGGPGSFFETRIVGEARMRRVTDEVTSIVGSLVSGWYSKPTATRTRIVNAELAGVRQLVLPMQLTFSDQEGGLRGYPDAHDAGAARFVARWEERWLLNRLQPKADLAFATFTDWGKLWAGSVPYGRDSEVKGSVGVSLLGSYPSGGMRVYRLDLAVPLQARGGSGWEVRLSAADITHWILRESRDVTRARSGAVPRNVFNFAPR